MINGNRDRRTRGKQLFKKDTKNKEVVSIRKEWKMGSTKIAWCVLMIYLTGNCRSKRDILFPQAIVLPTCLMVAVITLLEKYPSHFN